MIFGEGVLGWYLVEVKIVKIFGEVFGGSVWQDIRGIGDDLGDYFIPRLHVPVSFPLSRVLPLSGL